MPAVRRALLSCLLLAPLVFGAGAALADESVFAGRYVRVKPVATVDQMDPLETAVTISFPQGHFETVGDAARHLLRRSGYALAEPGIVLEDSHTRLLQFPLPEVHRRFETVAIVQILRALGGPSYEPVVDHVTRTITFELGQEYQALQPTTDEKRGKADKRTRADKLAQASEE